MLCTNSEINSYKIKHLEIKPQSETPTFMKASKATEKDGMKDHHQAVRVLDGQCKFPK